MKTNLIRSFVAIICGFLLSFNLYATFIEISGYYEYGYEFNADTLLVVGNYNFNNVTLKPVNSLITSFNLSDQNQTS